MPGRGLPSLPPSLLLLLLLLLAVLMLPSSLMERSLAMLLLPLFPLLLLSLPRWPWLLWWRAARN
jgi:hypothetical protein